MFLDLTKLGLYFVGPAMTDENFDHGRSFGFEEDGYYEFNFFWAGKKIVNIRGF